MFFPTGSMSFCHCTAFLIKLLNITDVSLRKLLILLLLCLTLILPHLSLLTFMFCAFLCPLLMQSISLKRSSIQAHKSIQLLNLSSDKIQQLHSGSEHFSCYWLKRMTQSSLCEGRGLSVWFPEYCMKEDDELSCYQLLCVTKGAR